MSEQDPRESPFPTPPLDTALSRTEPAPAKRRSARTLFAVVAATVLVVGATFTAVALRSTSDSDGGAMAPSPAPDWTAEAEEICSEAAFRAEALAGDPTVEARRRLAALGLETVGRLRAASPPPAVAADVDSVLAVWQSAFTRLGRAAGRPNPVRYELALLRVAPQLDEANAVAEAVGLGLCAEGVFSPHQRG